MQMMHCSFQKSILAGVWNLQRCKYDGEALIGNDKIRNSGRSMLGEREKLLIPNILNN